MNSIPSVVRDLAVLLVGVALTGMSANAATISWGSVFVMDDPTDVSKPVGTTVHLAADFNTPAGAATAGGDNVINGITFTTVDQDVPGLLTGNISSGPSYNATYHPAATGDQDLDDMLDSHSYFAGGPGTAILSVEGLSVGGVYRLQLIGVADSRTCCAGRVYEPDDGAGNFTTGITLQRGLFQSVIGTFTANAAAQTFQLRSLNNVATNNDPGLSGLVVLRVIPEPGAGLLALGAALSGLLRRQRRSR